MKNNTIATNFETAFRNGVDVTKKMEEMSTDITTNDNGFVVTFCDSSILIITLCTFEAVEK